MADRLARAVYVVIGRLVVHEEDVVEAACDHEAGESAQPGEAAFAFIFGKAGMLETGRRVPADRHAAILAIGDVEGAIDKRREAQARAGAKLQHSNAALEPVAERHEPDAGELRQRSRAARNVAPRQPGAEKLNHRFASFSMSLSLAHQ